MAALIIIDGPAEGQKFALEQHGLVMVGRDHSCTFQKLDPKMSRMHFQIKLDAKTESHSALDFDSANGVSVNGKRITDPTPLNDGDVIRTGNSSIVYSVEDAPDAQTITQLLRKHYQGRFDTELQ